MSQKKGHAVSHSPHGVSSAIRNRVLVIAYYWPPSGGAGVQRWLKFTKYFPDCGWDPVVFVPQGANYPVLDDTLVDEVLPTAEIWRAPIFEPAAWLDAFKLGRNHSRLGSSSPNDNSTSGGLVQWIRGNLFIPDARMFWIRPSIRRLQKLLRENPVEAIVSTGPPHSTHLIALGLKRAFPEIPWVADFRDPWSDMDYLDDFQLTAFSRARHKKLEQTVISKADKIVVTAPSAAQSLLGTPLDANENRAAFIPNGFDDEDGFDLPDAPTQGPFVIGFFGSLYGSRNAPGLWRAIQIHNANPDCTRRVELILYGSVDPLIIEELRQILSNRSWRFGGNIPHHEVPVAMAKCHALLILQNNNDTGRRTIPGKAYEYLATGRPLIVGGALKSDLERLILSWGFDMCAMEDSSGFANQIQEAINGRASTISPTQYQRNKLAAEYCKLLHNLVT